MEQLLFNETYSFLFALVEPGPLFFRVNFFYFLIVEHFEGLLFATFANQPTRWLRYIAAKNHISELYKIIFGFSIRKRNANRIGLLTSSRRIAEMPEWLTKVVNASTDGQNWLKWPIESCQLGRTLWMLCSSMIDNWCLCFQLLLVGQIWYIQIIFQNSSNLWVSCHSHRENAG